MLNISVVTTREVVADCCREYKILYSSGHYLYIARDRGKILAGTLFEIKSDYVEVQKFFGEDLEDFPLVDGIIRAGFNYADKQGISDGIIPDELRNEYYELFANLNFPKETRFNINNFFDKYKNCSN